MKLRRDGDLAARSDGCHLQQGFDCRFAHRSFGHVGAKVDKEGPFLERVPGVSHLGILNVLLARGSYSKIVGRESFEAVWLLAA